MTGTQRCGDLGFRFRQRHDERLLAVGGQAVAFVGDGVFAMPEQGVCRQPLAQCRHNVGLALGAGRDFAG